MKHATQAFDGFLDSDADDTDFFAIEEDENSGTEDDVIETEQTQNPPASEDSKSGEEKQDTDLFFAADEEEEEEDEEEDENAKKPKGDNKPGNTFGDDESVKTLQFLKEKGFVDYELEDGEELTEEKASELLEDSLDDMVEGRIKELFSEVPDVLKEINNFVLKGGDINEYLAKVAENNKSGLSIDMDLTSEDNQIQIVKKGLKDQGFDDEYIASQIEFLKDSKHLEKNANLYFTKWKDNKIKEEAAILKSQEDARKLEKDNRRELKSKVSNFLKETDSVSGFKVTRDDKKILPDYMSERTVKLDNGSVVTPMQRDLMRVLNSPTGSIQIAKLLKAATESGELDFKEITKNTETKVIKEVRDNVRRSKKSISRGSGDKQHLASYFD